MTSREKFEAWWEQEKYDDKLNYITGIMFNRIKANMFLSWEAASREQEQKLTDMAVQLANAESKCRELAAELSAVDKIHNEAVFITDDHYEQCPPEVQKMIRSLAVLQIPAYQAFLAEVRAQGVEMYAEHLTRKAIASGENKNHAYAYLAANFAAKLRKGAAL